MLAEAQIKTANYFFFGLWRKLIQRVEKRLEIPVAKKHVWTLTEDCEINFFFFFKYITLETAAPENRETATHHSGKGACVYATYRDRSVCAVACNNRCITGSSSFRFLFALRCCLNHSFFIRKISFPVYVLSQTLMKARRSRIEETCIMQAISQRWVRPTILEFHLLQEGTILHFNLTRLRSATSGDTSCWSAYHDFNKK